MRSRSSRADPQVIYVPEYSPSYVWGAPVWNEYPTCGIRADSVGDSGRGSTWAPSTRAGEAGEAGDGLRVVWRRVVPEHGLLRALRVSPWGQLGGGGWGRGAGGRMAWAHDPVHRMGVAYSSRGVASRYGSTRYAGAPRTISSAGRTGTAQMSRAATTGGTRSAAAGGWQHIGARQRSCAQRGHGFQSSNRGYAGSYGQAARSYGSAQSYRGSGATQGYRSAPSYGPVLLVGYSGAA